MSVALIPGTYDPITNGHLDIIERAVRIFDEVVVGVAASPTKNNRGPLFTLDERIEFARQATRRLENVRIESFNKLLVECAVDVGANAIIKGLRAIMDFESEFQQACLNYQLNANIETVFIMSSPVHMFLSSSMIKEIASLKGKVSSWVIPEVELALKKKFSETAS